MRPLQLVIAMLLGACIVLAVWLVGTARYEECAVAPMLARAVRIVDSGCWSCGSGNGPSADSLASLVELADDEVVVAIDEQPTHRTRRAALPDLIDARTGRQRSHGQFLDFEIESVRGQRRVLVLLH